MTRPRLVTLSFGLVFGAAFFVAMIGGGFCAGTLHVRRQTGPGPRDAAKVELGARDQAKLVGWWIHRPASYGNCVMVLHGIGDSRASSIGFAPMFLEHGYSVLAPDSRAHGSSGGDFVTYGLLEKYDVIGWTHWMRDQGCHKVYALGESLGAAIAIQAAALEPAFDAIVAESAFSDLKEIAEYRVAQTTSMYAFLAKPVSKFVVSSGMLYARLSYGLDFRQVSPVTSIRHASTPILLIHGLRDINTPPSHSQALAAANPRVSAWYPPNAIHTGAAASEPAEFRRRVLGWFAAH